MKFLYLLTCMLVGIRAWNFQRFAYANTKVDSRKVLASFTTAAAVLAGSFVEPSYAVSGGGKDFGSCSFFIKVSEGTFF